MAAAAHLRVGCGRVSGEAEFERRSERLKQALASAGLYSIQVIENKRLSDFIELFLRWNARTNLSSIRDEDGIIRRHIVESIACARALPGGIRTLLDFGSGGGFPGIPIAICRSEIAVTLAESQGKKAAFLREAARVLDCSTWNNPMTVHAGRAEMLHLEQFDCVTLRAVDRMEEAVRATARLVRPGGWLAVMTTVGDLPGLQAAAGSGFAWRDAVVLPGGENRVLGLGQLLVLSS